MSLPNWPPDDPEIAQALLNVWRDGSWGKYHGKYVPELTRSLAGYFSMPFVRLCSSGTVALEVGLHGLGVGPSSEVILGGYDFTGNFRGIEHLGAKPVLADVDQTDGCLSVETLEQARSDATAAVVVSHLHGGLAPMQAIKAWATTHSISVLEDACQAHGAIVDGQLAGSWGDVSILSFGGSKLMTAGRGGAVMTRREEVAQRMTIYVEQGNDAYPLSELQAAVLVPQLEKLNERNFVRQRAADRLRTMTIDCQAFQWIGSASDANHRPAYYKVAWLVAEPFDRAGIMLRANACGIPLQAGFRGFHKRSDRRCRRVGALSNSAAMSERLLLLHHPWLLSSDEALDEIATKLSALAG